MPITPCEKACPECPHFRGPVPEQLKGKQEHGCYSDRDHVIPQYIARAVGASALLRNFIKSEANFRQTCRWEHDIKTQLEFNNPNIIQIPTDRFMIDAIKRVRHNKKNTP